MSRTVMVQFIKNELNAYISTQRVHPNQDMVNLIIKAFEAYEEYKRLVSSPKADLFDSKYILNCGKNIQG